MKQILQEQEELYFIEDSKVHGMGIFAKKDIKKGAKIIEYVGDKISKEEAEKRAERQLELSLGNKECGAVYIFELNDEFDIDGNVEWNPARYMNHSCEPNCEIEIEDDRIWIIALRDIKKGEELNYNYGYDLEDFKEHICKCGAGRCIGYIVDEDHWDKVKEIIGKQDL